MILKCLLLKSIIKMPVLTRNQLARLQLKTDTGELHGYINKTSNTPTWVYIYHKSKTQIYKKLESVLRFIPSNKHSQVISSLNEDGSVAHFDSATIQKVMVLGSDYKKGDQLYICVADHKTIVATSQFVDKNNMCRVMNTNILLLMIIDGCDVFI